MSGLPKAAGVGGVVEINGRLFQTEPFTLAIIAELESHIIGLRSQGTLAPICAELEKVPEKFHDSILAAAVRQFDRNRNATIDDVMTFISTFEGIVFLFWRLLRDAYPEFADIEYVRKEVKGIPLAVLKAQIDAATGLADIKNSSGPTAPTSAGENQPTDPHESRGAKSIAP